VQGVIAARLKLVLSDPEPTAEETRALQRTFTRYLVRVDEGAVEGERLLRRVVPRASLPRAADRLLGRLVDAGLLLTRNATIELAHERLIDDWPQLPIKSWLAQDAADHQLIDQLRQRVDDDTLPDGLLAQAEELLQRDHELAAEEPALATLVQRSRGQKRAREWRRRALLVSTFIAALVLAALAMFAFVQREEAIKQTQLAIENAAAAETAAKRAEDERDKARAQVLAMQARRADTQANTPFVVERAGSLAVESAAIAHKSNRLMEADAVEASRSALIRLPLLFLKHGRGSIQSLVALPDGRLASSDDNDGLIKVWSKDGQGKPLALMHGSQIESMVALPDGRLASGGSDGLIKVWPKDGQGEPLVLTHGGWIKSLVVLLDGRLASSGIDGQVKLWPKGGQGEPVVLSHGSPVFSLAVLPDGRLVSGGE
jgi:hypothetical protein